jgi:exonuclease VII large subunit
VTPETGPQAEQIELAPVAVPETIRVAPALPPAAAPANPDTVEATPADAPTETPPTPAENAVPRAQQVLEAYYADLQAAPFNAAQHFAPTVDRFYTLSGTTPAAIEAELNRTHFPEFTEAETRIEPGTLQVSPAINDGSRVVTYRERSRAFRQSLQKHQQTAAQVRVRLDKNFKIMYLRQEKLLENTFTD